MPNKVDQDKLIKRHASMLTYQKRIDPFTPTIRDLQKLWGLRTTSAVHRAIREMEKNKLVISRRHGLSKKYFAVDSA